MYEIIPTHLVYIKRMIPNLPLLKPTGYVSWTFVLGCIMAPCKSGALGA